MMMMMMMMMMMIITGLSQGREIFMYVNKQSVFSHSDMTRVSVR
jgi:hypothetical protein